MLLHKAQAEIASDTHRFRVVICGRRFGKTTLAVQEMIANALSGNERKVAYIAPTYQQARDIAWQELKRGVQNIATNINESRLEITVKTIKEGTSTLYLRGWEAIESLRGNRFDFLVLDEVASYRGFWVGWHEVLRPTLTDTKGQALFIGTPKGFNHFYDLYNVQDEDYKSFHFTSYDNPHIPSEEIDKAKEEITEDRFAQEYLADFRKTEGLVYKEFDRTRHLVGEGVLPNSVSDTILGIDFGYTNPSAILCIKTDTDSHYWVTSEFYKTKQTTEQIAEYAKQFNATKVYPDPAEPDRIEILKRSGLNCREVSKDIVAGVDHVRELFKQNRIHIHQDCKNLIYELETYRYPDKRPDQNESEKPVKENDHLLDALRYALYAHSPVVEVPDPYFDTYGTHYVD